MVKAVSCPNCGGAVTIKYAETTLSIVCPRCLTVFSKDNESLQILTKVQKKLAEPLIKLGERYKFHGQDWEAIGFLLRSDKTESYKWFEYLLFNPYAGYRFLVCMDGHWSYVVKTKSAPAVDKILKTAVYLKKSYKLFHKGPIKTLFVLGEFYWKVKTNEKVDGVDYINPPEILSMEKDSDEEIWTLGQYIPRHDVEKAFKLQGKMPLDIGVAPHQPSSHNNSKTIQNYTTYMLGLLFIAQCFFVLGVRRSEVFNQTYELTDAKGYKFQTPTFTITDKMGYIEAHLNANVNNNWFEYTAEVVKEENPEEEDNYEFDQGVEMYSGYDSDGSWREGSQSTDRRIGKLAPGNYHLNLSTDSGASGPITMNITLSEGNLSWGNFIFALVLLVLYPGYYLVRANKFEKERWSQSDHSPYWNENYDD